MEKYQIYEVKEKQNHAGSKARDDIERFAEEVGYAPIKIICRSEIDNSYKERLLRFVFPFISWINVIFLVKRNSLILLQNPFLHRQFGRNFVLSFLKRFKKCKIVSIIHDVEFLRRSDWQSKNVIKEFNFMKSNSDYFIVHNKIMLKEFVEFGFDKERLISLDIFDYYCKEQNCQNVSFEELSDVVIAGNLSLEKCPYIYKLADLKTNIKLNLYGPFFDEKYLGENIVYNGSFPADKVPAIISGKFGLIWDGDSIDTCSGNTGDYLRYNNPHKTSLYLAAGLPVIIWEEAAMSNFIVDNHLGLLVSSLEEASSKISSIKKKDYYLMKENAQNISKKLNQGYYIKNALAEFESRLENKAN